MNGPRSYNFQSFTILLWPVISRVVLFGVGGRTLFRPLFAGADGHVNVVKIRWDPVFKLTVSIKCSPDL